MCILCSTSADSALSIRLLARKEVARVPRKRARRSCTLTGGGPGAYSTYNLYFYAFKTSFEHTNLGYGAVLAYVVTAIVIVFGLVLTRGGKSLRLS